MSTRHLSPSDVVVVDAVRTPICKARRGSLKDVSPDDLLYTVLLALRERNGLDPALVGDIAVGNVQQSGSYAFPARTAMLRAGYPYTTPIYALNRQCSSGLQAVANIAASIAAGEIRIGIAAGVESMSASGRPGEGEPPPMNDDAIGEHLLAASCLTPMGITAENVAERYGISRAVQDAMAVASHAKALAAADAGLFADEMVAVQVASVQPDGSVIRTLVAADDGPRRGTSLESLARLRPVFRPDGTVTAGSSSQLSDGAAAVLLTSRGVAESLGLRVLATLRSFRVVGVLPEEMGVGPALAIPAALDAAGVGLDEVDVFEINEAFAAQAVYCARELRIPLEKLNPLGGAIALGHPLGCTGARMVATLVHELARSRRRWGVASMCIGTGMGAAAVFEAE